MPILKAQPEPSRPLIKDAVVLDLGDLGKQAAALKADAQAKAAKIIAEAEAQAAEIVAGAEAVGHEKGFAQGQTEGEEAGRSAGHAEALTAGETQIKQATQAFTKVAEQWEQQRLELDRDAREAVLDLALRIAKKVVHRVVEVDASVVVDQVSKSLERVLEPTDVVIRIHPDDRPALSEVLPDVLARFTHLKHVKLTDDPEVGQGGCVLTAGEGRIDATLDTQLRRIAELIAPGRGDNETNEQAPTPSSS